MAIGDLTTIKCTVDAQPPDVAFSWTVNNEEITSGFSADQLTSLLSIKPTSKADYGVISCWAKNVVGTQDEPCVFELVAVGPPQPLSACFVANRSSSTLLINCDKGFDGGLRQTFHLELFDSKHQLILTKNSEVPTFLITNLASGSDFTLLLHASNSKGKSSKYRLTAQTFTLLNKKFGKESFFCLITYLRCSTILPCALF